MNILDLDDYSREKFILNLPDVADIIVLEHTNRELRDWINENDIYRRWERKHLGKTDKWRILLLQELGVKGRQSLFFEHKADNMSVTVQINVRDQYLSYYTVILNRFDLSRSADTVALKYRHYLHDDLAFFTRQEDSEQRRSRITVSHTTRIGMYYFMYDILRLGFEYGQNLDMGGDYVDNRFIRFRCTDGLPTHKCSHCQQEFCGKTDCPEWLNHTCENFRSENSQEGLHDQVQ